MEEPFALPVLRITALEFSSDLALIGSAVVLGLVAAFVVGKAARALASVSKYSQLSERVSALRAPLRLLLPVLFVLMIVERTGLPPPLSGTLRDILQIAFVGAATWLALRAVSVGETVALERFRVDVADNLKARQVHTQITLVRRIVSAAVLVLAVGAVMLSLEPVRRIGTALLASAGVLGIIIGFAAQRSIGMVLAGLQVAFAQPIRLDDVVIVEGEWGRIEEITLTYVVVRIWDLRRLVLPVSYFIEKPFQNWTRVSADLLGSVFLYTDYTVPVAELRSNLRKILERCPNWDGRVCGLQVTNSDAHTLELRALMSAADAPTLWDLRCEVRERLVEYLQQHYPQALPRTRALLVGDRTGVRDHAGQQSPNTAAGRQANLDGGAAPQPGP